MSFFQSRAGLAHPNGVRAGTRVLIERLGGGHQDLLRNTAAERAGATDVSPLDDENRPACLASDPGGCLTRVTGADHDEVVVVAHRPPPSGRFVSRQGKAHNTSLRGRPEDVSGAAKQSRQTRSLTRCASG